MQIKKRFVDNYVPGECIPHIHLRVMCESGQRVVEQEDVIVTLTGTGGCGSFVLDCNPPIPTTSSMSSSVSNRDLVSIYNQDTRWFF